MATTERRIGRTPAAAPDGGRHAATAAQPQDGKRPAARRRQADPASGADLPAPSDEGCRQMYRVMALARALDDRIWKLSRQGAIPFAVTGRGQEAAQAGMGLALRPGIDYVYPYYRDVALVLHLGLTATDILMAAFGRAGDPSSGGRQMPNHFSLRAARIISGSSPVGTQLPHAAGTALACKLRGEDAAVLVTFGEGASSQGDFHEACNFAAIHRLPVVFACENNGWAISVPERLQVAAPGIAARAAAYGMPGARVDGTDPVLVYRATAAALARARAGAGPTLLELRVPRLDPHTSSDDDTTYRSAEERQALPAADPLPRFRALLAGQGQGAALEAIDAEIAELVETATFAAETAAPPAPADLARHVYGAGYPWP